MDQKEYQKQWREKNVEKRRKYAKEWKSNNIERVKELNAKYEKKNKEKIKARYKQYRENNLAKLLEKGRKYRLENKDKIKKQTLIRKETQNFIWNIRKKISQFTKGKYKSLSYTKTNNLRKTIYAKLFHFSGEQIPMFTVDQFLEKFGQVSNCYITGDIINLQDTRSWHVDHIIPISRGGDNSLENCGITTSIANLAKNSMTYQELVEFCYKVTKHYEIHNLGGGGQSISPG